MRLRVTRHRAINRLFLAAVSLVRCCAAACTIMIWAGSAAPADEILAGLSGIARDCARRIQRAVADPDGRRRAARFAAGIFRRGDHLVGRPHASRCRRLATDVDLNLDAAGAGLARADAAHPGARKDRHRRAHAIPIPRRHRRHQCAAAELARAGGAGTPERARARAQLHPLWNPAHHARRGPPAVRAGAAADRRGSLDAGKDRLGIHRGPQHDAGRGDARLCQRAGDPVERRHRAVHPLPRARNRPLGAARRASRSGSRGWWPSPSGCCTASASPAA